MKATVGVTGAVLQPGVPARTLLASHRPRISTGSLFSDQNGYMDEDRDDDRLWMQATHTAGLIG